MDTTLTRYDIQNIARISDATAFDSGETFTSEAQVLAYFTVANMDEMFGADGWAGLPQTDLDEMAALVIANRWHCAF